MTKKLLISVRDKNVEEINRIKTLCDDNNISFSAFSVDAIIIHSKKVIK